MKSTEKSPDFNWLQFLGAASHLHVSVWDASRLYSAPRSVRWELPLRRGGSEIFKEHLQNKHSAVSLMENMDTAPLTCFRDGVLNPHPSGLRNRSRTRSSNFLPLCVRFLRLIDSRLVGWFHAARVPLHAPVSSRRAVIVHYLHPKKHQGEALLQRRRMMNNEASAAAHTANNRHQFLNQPED